MTDAHDITGGLDLLGDWLDAKGFTEEAGLCLRVLGLIHEQAEEIEKLREALKPFAGYHVYDTDPDDEYTSIEGITVGDLRAAYAALKETGND